MKITYYNTEGELITTEGDSIMTVQSGRNVELWVDRKYLCELTDLFGVSVL